MYYPVCEMLHIKDPLLLIGKSSPCSGSRGFSLLLSESANAILTIKHFLPLFVIVFIFILKSS